MGFGDKIETIRNHQNEICTIISTGVNRQYPTIQRLYNMKNKTEDDNQQLFTTFCSFYGVRFKNQLNINNLRDLLIQGPRNQNAVPSLRDAIEDISLEKIEFSFATKVRHTINNNHLIFDSHVSNFFNGIKVIGNSGEEKIQSAEDIYSQLESFYAARRQNGLAELIDIFDAHFPDAKFSDVKKLDFMIWGWGKWTKSQKKQQKRGKTFRKSRLKDRGKPKA